jgi:hypothetical protein
MNPAVHFGLPGAGSRAWFGWPNIPQLETLTTDWVRATDQTKRKQLAHEIQKVALREVAYERLLSREWRAVCQRRIGQGLEAQRAETEALVGPDPANLWRHRRSAA